MREPPQEIGDQAERAVAVSPRQRTLQWAWMAGTVVIVLSWTDAVPVTVGWVGFGLAAAATVASRWPGAASARAPRQP